MEDFRSDSASKNRLRLWLRLLKASHRIEQTLRERMRRELLTTLPRFDVMAALSRYPDGLRMSELSQELKVSNGNVTGIVDRLVNEGLLARAKDQGDGRAFRIKLTSSGLSAFNAQARAHEIWINELLDDVAPQEADALSSQLETIITRLDSKEALT